MLSEIKNNNCYNSKQMNFPLEFNKEFEYFQNKLKPLKGLEEGDKIGKDSDDNYILFKAGMFQKAWRNYYGENREKSEKYLSEDFQKFSAFLDKVCDRGDSDLLNIFKEFAYKVSDFSQKIIHRLYNLKKTYVDLDNNKSIIASIDSIILTLIDFKDKITKIYENKNLGNMSLYLRSDRLSKSM